VVVWAATTTLVVSAFVMFAVVQPGEGIGVLCHMAGSGKSVVGVLVVHTNLLLATRSD